MDSVTDKDGRVWAMARNQFGCLVAVSCDPPIDHKQDAAECQKVASEIAAGFALSGEPLEKTKKKRGLK
jgi:hypothetical protein